MGAILLTAAGSAMSASSAPGRCDTGQGLSAAQPIVGSPAKVAREVTDDDLKPRAECRPLRAALAAYSGGGLGVVGSAASWRDAPPTGTSRDRAAAEE